MVSNVISKALIVFLISSSVWTADTNPLAVFATKTP